MLAADKHMRLVDVRTEPEWTYFGVPALADLGKAVAKISWQVFRDVSVESGFLENRSDLPSSSRPAGREEGEGNPPKATLKSHSGPEIAFRCAGAAATPFPRRSSWRKSVTSS
ncbi:protein of unknown function [Bradyrhizobium vignae]|uniref:Rhodanese domain-containing protein n=1 Tax=Bradyrhizobium vignae TaxID=1549949 RepID=A0A2U3PUT8_9BRAD|nr:protein of unknown function [Bradyrhizobium vignae]